LPGSATRELEALAPLFAILHSVRSSEHSRALLPLTRMSCVGVCSSGAFCTTHNYDPNMSKKREEESRRCRGTWERQSPEPGIWPDNHLKSSVRDSFGWPHRATARPQTGAGCSDASMVLQERVQTASRSGSMSVRSARAGDSDEAASTGTVSTPRASTARSVPAYTIANSPGTFSRIPAVCSNRSPINLIQPYVPPYTVDRLLEEKTNEAFHRKSRSPTTCAVSPAVARGRAQGFYAARDCVSAARYRTSCLVLVVDIIATYRFLQTADARRYQIPN
jgi:hypothetical protein